MGDQTIYKSFVCFSESGMAFEAVLNALPSVDSFFLMGGTLTAYIVFRELEKAGSNSSRSVGDHYYQRLYQLSFRHLITTILYYVHRYLRLTIPYALVLAVIVAVLPHLASGPQWSLYVGASEVPYSLLAIKIDNISQGMQNIGMAKLTLCERSHR